MQNASATPAQNGGNSPLPASDKPVKELDKAQMPPKVLPSQQTATHHTNTTNSNSPSSTTSDPSPTAESPQPTAEESASSAPTPENDQASDQTSSDNNSGGGTTAQKSNRMGKIIGGLALLVLVVGGALSALFLTETGQDIRNQAAYYDNNKTSTGLKVLVSSEPGSASASNYKPAASDVNTSFYDQGAGESVSFSVPITNESGGTVNDEYQLLAFKINRVNDREDGWMDVDENTPMSERRMYENHKQNNFSGTEQSLTHAGGWKSFSIAAGETKTLTDSWKPGPNDCGMYQLDMQVKSAPDDQIVAVGMIRVKNCQPDEPEETVRISGSVVCYENADGQSYAVTNATVNVANKNYSTNQDGVYTSDSYDANTLIAARLSLPAQLQLRNTKTGATMTVPSAGLTSSAFNGCENSQTPNFMQTNCGGINDQRATQCQNAKSRPKGYPDSYEWCTLQGGAEQRTGFDFALHGCVKQTATPTPTPVVTPTPTPTPTPPYVGGMCVALCGITAQNASSVDFSACNRENKKIGPSPTIGDTINFKCFIQGQTQKVQISVREDGGALQNLTTRYDGSGYIAQYPVTKPVTVAASCTVTAAEPGTYTPPENTIPRGTQTACPTSDSNYSCVASLEACAAIGNIETIALSNGQATNKYSCSGTQVCCKKDPAKVNDTRQTCESAGGRCNVKLSGVNNVCGNKTQSDQYSCNQYGTNGVCCI